jgi:dienelactone hydrolase
MPLVFLLLLPMCARRMTTTATTTDLHADHTTTSTPAAPAPATNWAKEAVDRSPRHREWVNVKAGDRTVIGATVPKMQDLMTAAGKTYDIVTYEGAGHGFMRAGDAPPPPADADEKTKEAYAGNKKARDAAWVRWKDVLREVVSSCSLPSGPHPP